MSVPLTKLLNKLGKNQIKKDKHSHLNDLDSCKNVTTVFLHETETLRISNKIKKT